ncbi:MAG: diphosphate--fructose-6-phosphate 1-phosphotransferase, partial [Anaerovoracaceae bacterium]
VAGVVHANQLNPIYDKVYGGLHGIEGILEEKFYDLTNMSKEENRILRQTPAAALGSCRYKLKKENKEDFDKIFAIIEKYDIDAFFYTGGDDSMNTVNILAQAAAERAKENPNDRCAKCKFIGCPKTVDNDLVITDHCPGFGSAAKYINAVVNSTWLDYNVYTRKEVFILETMGRDAGWLAASSCLTGKVDILILPEVPFDQKKFLEIVDAKVKATNKCYVVVSEGARFADGTYIAARETANDSFGHARLGGAASALEDMITEAGIDTRCKVQDLSTAQRCAVIAQSKTDVEESFNLGMSAHMHSMANDFTGYMVAVKRGSIEKDELGKTLDPKRVSAGLDYNPEFYPVKVDQIAGFNKGFKKDWILKDMAGVSKEALDYVAPLIEGEPNLIMKNGVPAFVLPYYMR